MPKSRMPAPPSMYREFTRRFPKLGAAWEEVGKAGREGPLSDREARLVKLAVAVGSLREGAVHSNVRKALASGMSSDEIEHVIALAAGTIGFPAAVATYSWVRDYRRS